MAYHRTREELIVPPACEPITLAEACEACRIDAQFDAPFVQACITTARRTLEQWCWSAFVMQTWQYWFDRWWWKMFLPRGPMRVGWNERADPMRPQAGTNAGGIVFVRYLRPQAQNAGPASYATLDPSVYETSQENQIPFLRAGYLQTFPVTRGYRDDITVQVVCGYGPRPQDVPEEIRQAMKLFVAFLYANRGEVPAECPPAIDMLIAPYRLKEF